MHFRLALMLTAALLMWGALPCFAADDPVDVAQLTDMAGQAAPERESDEELFSDFDEDEFASDTEIVADPIEGFNRVMFAINDGLYHGVFKPVARGYAWIIPAKPRQWVRNFFTNMLFPVRFVNNILQGKFDAAYMETSKFIVNTSFGVLGFGDVTAGMPRNWEPERPTASGLGQTLGKAGFGHGFYIVWPFIGPSSVRETVGWVGDAYLDPLTYGDLTLIEFGAVRVYKNLNNLSLQLRGNEYELMTEGAVDKYAAVRDAYIRYRAKKVAE